MLTLPPSSILTLADDVYLDLLIYYLRMKGFNVTLNKLWRALFWCLWIASISGYLCISSLVQKILKNFGTSCMFCKTNYNTWNMLFMFVYQSNILICTLWTMATHTNSINHELFTEYLTSMCLSFFSSFPFYFWNQFSVVLNFFLCILHWQMWNIFSKLNMPSRSCWVTKGWYCIDS